MVSFEKLALIRRLQGLIYEDRYKKEKEQA